ncbi:MULTISPECIES: biopolymer transporter ExbD [Niveibacterium]|uniref:Biopolymer transporter ExbD n=1 Tax=Niveibacterium microcysteis TaxID=2811415 RepID=A0ABX7MCF0_9RHOO|nr:MULTISPECIES: biopolymer transporter ExbD [Niveibacterium]QSI78433.1 biopolymer transporter ExbD [Niveibacterium microcysteis]
MNFRRGRRTEDVEINLIPLIDVMLVIIIFLMLTTTYSKFSGLEINLPTAAAPAAKSVPNEIDVIVTAVGDVIVNRVPVSSREPAAIADALRRARPQSEKEPVVIINADAKTPHQAVIDVMQAAQAADLPQITFATQASQN